MSSVREQRERKLVLLTESLMALDRVRAHPHHSNPRALERKAFIPEVTSLHGTASGIVPRIEIEYVGPSR
jgi:hypothetical protein